MKLLFFQGVIYIAILILLLSNGQLTVGVRFAFLILQFTCSFALQNVAKCNLCKVKIEPMLVAVVSFRVSR